MAAVSHLVYSLPPLPSSELADPHDDITLPRLIEALQNRHRIRQMMIAEYNKTGACSHSSSALTSWFRLLEKLDYLSCSLLHVILANMMKSMLQEMDGNLISNDNFIQEQNDKLLEKDKIIQGNKADIERLEKKTKMQEHKVRDKNIKTSWKLLVCRYDTQILKCPMWLCSRLTSCRKLLKSMRVTSAHCSKNWKPENRGCIGSCLRRDAWRSACMVWSQTPRTSGRKNV